MALVDLGLSLMDASLEECEDELEGLHNTLESMVGWLTAAATASRGSQRWHFHIPGRAQMHTRINSSTLRVYSPRFASTLCVCLR